MILYVATTPSKKHLCFLSFHPSGAVFCDCSIIDHSKDLPPLRIFLGDHPFELPVAELFSKIPTKDGGSDFLGV